jgi:hypothetical protein
MKLLVANETIGPVYFSIAKDGETPRWLYVNRAVPNQNLKPVVIREVVDGLCSVIHGTVDAWDTSEWAVPAATQPSRQRKR